MSTAPSRRELWHLQQQGRTRELRAALRAARWRAAGCAWVRFGQSVAWLLGPIVATVVYCTLFLPFGCGARLLRARRGLWRVPRSAGTTAAALRSPA